MKKFFTFYILLSCISFYSFAQDEMSSGNLLDDINFQLEIAKNKTSYYYENMQGFHESDASYFTTYSFGKYHYWLGRVHAFEHCYL